MYNINVSNDREKILTILSTQESEDTKSCTKWEVSFYRKTSKSKPTLNDVSVQISSFANLETNKSTIATWAEIL